ncbi:hypothetical protein GWI33_015090 [Rhynchophorus ferrugineus]|uniref:Uncharacterized protein n=1 Tax=Rhynchophorus ferrugineus TaxID=354439 RepID=A0A834MBR6_RHYFE|nr:hypothetical protein GWI33_015090 [Rhynchophorus ferrugineus]
MLEDRYLYANRKIEQELIVQISVWIKNCTDAWWLRDCHTCRTKTALPTRKAIFPRSCFDPAKRETSCQASAAASTAEKIKTRKTTTATSPTVEERGPDIVEVLF